MKVLIFGATGRVGTAATEQALAAGHQVSVFVRSRSRLGPGHGAARVLEGDMQHPESLAAALAEGCDAVLCAIGGDVFKPSTLVRDSAAAIIAAMHKAQVRRYLGVSGVAEMPQKTLAGNLSAALMRRSPIRHAVADHDAAYELIARSGLTFTLAACPHIRDEPGRGTYQLAPVFPGGYRHIAPADVAHFLVHELTAARYVNQIVGIWY